MDLQEFLTNFHDHLAHRLDVYEQAIYLYLVRHSRLLGLQEVTIGFKSARTRLACGIGTDGTPMSEGTAYKKLASLQSKGAVEILRTDYAGRRIRVRVPSEIPGVIPSETESPPPDLERIDFFSVAENRLLILKREEFRCFYTLRHLDERNYVIDHVVPGPARDNSYRNVVAASREANNRKGKQPADDFIRRLFREGYLTEAEFRDRLVRLAMLQRGELKPDLPIANSNRAAAAGSHLLAGSCRALRAAPPQESAIVVPTGGPLCAAKVRTGPDRPVAPNPEEIGVPQITV